jgi:tetratricopeptide (TPR) repeat protein
MVGLGSLVVVLGLFYLVQTLIAPHKLDSIKAMMEAGKYEQAITALNNVLKKEENNPLAHLYLAESYYFSSKEDMALVEYRQVLHTGKFSNSATERVIRKRLADIYLKFGQLEEAQKEFLLLLEAEPANPDYLFNIGKIFYDRGMKEQALSYLDKAVKSGKNSPTTYFFIGKVFFDMSRTAEALSAFTNCVKIDPKNNEAHYHIGLILKASNGYANAIKEFDIAEQSKDNTLRVKAIYQKGLCKLEMNDTDGAKVDFERGLKYSNEENNTTVAIRYTLGMVYERERRLLEAVEQWEKVAQLKPNYQDVQMKLAQYEDLRVDDRLKDLLTSTPTTFEIMCQNLLKQMGYEVIESKLQNDDTLDIVGVERSQKWRNVKGGRVLVKVSRSHDEIHDDEIAKMVENLKLVHGIRGIYITTGKFTPQAIRYSENRPVDLYDRQKITHVMREKPQ